MRILPEIQHTSIVLRALVTHPCPCLCKYSEPRWLLRPVDIRWLLRRVDIRKRSDCHQHAAVF